MPVHISIINQIPKWKQSKGPSLMKGHRKFVVHPSNTALVRKKRGIGTCSTEMKLENTMFKSQSQ
jgi:hypothetical protein